MNPQLVTTIATIIKTLVDVGPDVIKGVMDAKPFAEQIIKSIFGKKDVTPEEMAELEAKIDDLAAQLQVPLPPET